MREPSSFSHTRTSHISEVEAIARYTVNPHAFWSEFLLPWEKVPRSGG
jgi:hypothetical protein